MRKSKALGGNGGRTKRGKTLFSSPYMVERFHNRAREVEKTAKRLVDEEGIESMASFKEKFPETYKELNAFGMLPTVEKHIKLRHYTSLEEEELLDRFSRLVKDKGIESSTKQELLRHDPALYQALESKGLASKVLSGAPTPHFTKKCLERMQRVELREYARKLIAKEGIKSEKELMKRDKDLYLTLARKEILGLVLKESFGKKP